MVEPHIEIQGMAYVPGVAQGALQWSAGQGDDGAIAIVADHQLTLPRGSPAGIIVVGGAPFSHAMIRFLGSGVPTVIVSSQQAQNLKAGCRVMVDGASGRISSQGVQVTTQPLPAVAAPAGFPITTRDGIAIELRASVRSIAAARRAVASGAAAIGLVRTEFFMPEDGSPPAGAYYRQQFGALCETAAGIPVIFRLLDISADKRPAWLPATPAMESLLGLQGARLFDEPVVAHVVADQLGVIAELAGYCAVSALIPYLTHYEELARRVQAVRERLPVGVPVGAMVETPAGALDVARWFEHADFVAVGCNDLMQGLFAADRDRPELVAYLDPYAPLLYRFLRTLAAECDSHLGSVQLCGVLPQLAGVLPLLIGLGYRNFSVEAGLLPFLAETVRVVNGNDAARLAAEVCAAPEARDVVALLGVSSATAWPFAVGGA